MTTEISGRSTSARSSSSDCTRRARRACHHRPVTVIGSSPTASQPPTDCPDRPRHPPADRALIERLCLAEHQLELCDPHRLAHQLAVKLLALPIEFPFFAPLDPGVFHATVRTR